jgi:ABC-type phosphate transport system permease subunit
VWSTRLERLPIAFRARLAILIAVTIGLAVATALVPRIPQDPGYHHFADQRPLFGIPRALDVLSNVPFFVVGLWGLVITFRQRVAERCAYLTLFTGVLLTCFGSAY